MTEFYEFLREDQAHIVGLIIVTFIVAAFILELAHILTRNRRKK